MKQQTHHGMPLNLKPDYTVKLYAISVPEQCYVGTLFFYEGEGWTHSLLRFDAKPLPSAEAAQNDFFATKQSLLPAVHKQIFG